MSKKMLLCSLLLFPFAFNAQLPGTVSVRNPFRRVAIRATLVIRRQDGSDTRNDEANKALDEVEIEAVSAEEKSVLKLLEKFASQVRSNNFIRSRIDSQLKIDEISQRPDLGERINNARLDSNEMNRREGACTDAIEEMLNHNVNVDLPACANVILEEKDMKLKFDKL